MNKEKHPVAVIYGGRGAEHEVSCSGAVYLLSLLGAANIDTLPVFIDKSGAWYKHDGDGRLLPTYPVRMGNLSGFLSGGEITPVSAAFPLLHGDFGEDGSVQGALECAGIPYIGAGVGASALSLDKAAAKLLAEHLEIPTTPWLLSEKNEDAESVRERAEKILGYPMFIKPTSAGSSFGAHPIRCREELLPALLDARGFATGRVIIERLLSPIRELEVAFFECGGLRIVSDPGEVSAGGFYDYREKYSKHSRARLFPRAELPEEISGRIRGYADTLARALDLRHIGRLDFFLLGDEIYFNEVNTMPGFTEGSLYTKMMAEAGVSPVELVGRLLTDGVGL